MDGHLIAFVALLGVAMICKLRTSRGRQTMVEVFGRLFHGSCSGFTSPLQGNKVMMRIGGCSGELAPGELVVVDRTFDYRASPPSCAAVCNSDGLLCIIRNDACALWFCHISSDIDCLKWGRLGLLMAIECLLVWRNLMAVEDNVVWRFPMLKAPLTSSKLVSSQRTHQQSDGRGRTQDPQVNNPQFQPANRPKSWKSWKNPPQIPWFIIIAPMEESPQVEGKSSIFRYQSRVMIDPSQPSSPCLLPETAGPDHKEICRFSHSVIRHFSKA